MRSAKKPSSASRFGELVRGPAPMLRVELEEAVPLRGIDRLEPAHHLLVVIVELLLRCPRLRVARGRNGGGGEGPGARGGVGVGGVGAGAAAAAAGGGATWDSADCRWLKTSSTRWRSALFALLSCACPRPPRAPPCARACGLA